MPAISVNTTTLVGLRESDIPRFQARFGKNVPSFKKKSPFVQIVLNVLKEPMVILLFVACLLYFLLNNVDSGLMMIAAIAFVVGISIYQDVRSSNALKELREFTEQKIKVIRGGQEKLIAAQDLVPDDLLLLEEGSRIPADARVIQQNDFTVSEAVITGESLPVSKTSASENNVVYQGSIVNSGTAYAVVTATGNNTVLQKLGKSIDELSSPKTLLQKQVQHFVKRFTILGVFAFLLICFVNFFETGDWERSLLLGLTLALAAIPEEIPVAFSSFMALGAWRMSKLGIISRQPQTIENLGAVSVICLDKTGTITENKMKLNAFYDFGMDKRVEMGQRHAGEGSQLLFYAMLASEANPYDAMEQAIHEAYKFIEEKKERPAMVYEYALGGQPPMMTHVYQYENEKLITCKGAAERIIDICGVSKQDYHKIKEELRSMASTGCRVLGVASARINGDSFPESQEQFDWNFEGLLSIYDPPKKNIREVFSQFYNAGIQIKLLTGDYSETAIAIARQVGMRDIDSHLTGEQLLKLEGTAMERAVTDVNVFTRMFPEAKRIVIETLKRKGQIVAMTGDGINDGPALKTADVGIAMGLKGTEIARQAADLVLTDDNIAKIAEALKQGRKILNNLKKAIRYIISIHIPIISVALIPLVFGWKFPAVFSPIHIIFLELIMGPTCSIFFEREPVESRLMNEPPRKRSAALFSTSEFLISLIQGVVIAASLLVYYYFYMQQHSLSETTTVIFTALVSANISLTFVNRSFSEIIVNTIHYKNNLAPAVLIISISFLGAIHFVPFISELFQMSSLSLRDFVMSVGIGFLSTMWFEVYKLVRFRTNVAH